MRTLLSLRGSYILPYILTWSATITSNELPGKKQNICKHAHQMATHKISWGWIFKNTRLMICGNVRNTYIIKNYTLFLVMLLSCIGTETYPLFTAVNVEVKKVEVSFFMLRRRALFGAPANMRTFLTGINRLWSKRLNGKMKEKEKAAEINEDDNLERRVHPKTP